MLMISMLMHFQPLPIVFGGTGDIILLAGDLVHPGIIHIMAVTMVVTILDLGVVTMVALDIRIMEADGMGVMAEDMADIGPVRVDTTTTDARNLEILIPVVEL